MTPAAISIKDLGVERGTKLVIPGLDLDISSGEITDLLGPSGSGKTTLLARPRVLILDEPTVGLDPVLRDDLWRTFRELVDGGTEDDDVRADIVSFERPSLRGRSVSRGSLTRTVHICCTA